jgi:tRNA (guanine37-N1)-methyltransferase
LRTTDLNTDMEFTVLTIFPNMFDSFWRHGIVRRALAEGRIAALAMDIRDHAQGRHRATDDRPYGGGCGMVMKPEPLAQAIQVARQASPGAWVIHLSPQGRVLDQPLVAQLARLPGLILVCGRYEGVDERVVQGHMDVELSIGDYIMTGGELGAMVVMDAVTRLIPGVLGGEDSAALDSFSDHMLEHEHYTRPPEFEGEVVPEVLLSGNHGEIEKWRLEQTLIRTFLKRPDLLARRRLSTAEREIISGLQKRLEALMGETARWDTAGPVEPHH